MNNEEKILLMLEALASNAEATNSKLDALTSEVKEIRSTVDNLETKVDNLETRMIAAEKQAAWNFEFLIHEFERSDKRILSYLEERALNEAGEKAKASLGLA